MQNQLKQQEMLKKRAYTYNYDGTIIPTRRFSKKPRKTNALKMQFTVSDQATSSIMRVTQSSRSTENAHSPKRAKTEPRSASHRSPTGRRKRPSR